MSKMMTAVDICAYQEPTRMFKKKKSWSNKSFEMINNSALKWLQKWFQVMFYSISPTNFKLIHCSIFKLTIFMTRQKNLLTWSNALQWTERMSGLELSGSVSACSLVNVYHVVCACCHSTCVSPVSLYDSCSSYITLRFVLLFQFFIKFFVKGLFLFHKEHHNQKLPHSQSKNKKFSERNKHFNVLKCLHVEWINH